MWALIVLILAFVGFKVMDSKGKGQISYAYTVQIANDEEQLQNDFDISEVNNIAQTSDNKDELIFDSGLTAVINNKDFQFVNSESEERIEYEQPRGLFLREMFEKEDRNLSNHLKVIQGDDLFVKKQIRRYVIEQGLKVYMTKDRYLELKKTQITFAKNE